jgi:hypothetical protein
LGEGCSGHGEAYTAERLVRMQAVAGGQGGGAYFRHQIRPISTSLTKS